MLLDEWEREFRGLGLILPAEQAYALYGPLAAARGRLWRALGELERPCTDVAFQDVHPGDPAPSTTP